MGNSKQKLFRHMLVCYLLVSMSFLHGNVNAQSAELDLSTINMQGCDKLREIITGFGRNFRITNKTIIAPTIKSLVIIDDVNMASFLRKPYQEWLVEEQNRFKKTINICGKAFDQRQKDHEQQKTDKSERLSIDKAMNAVRNVKVKSLKELPTLLSYFGTEIHKMRTGSTNGHIRTLSKKGHTIFEKEFMEHFQSVAQELLPKFQAELEKIQLTDGDASKLDTAVYDLTGLHQYQFSLNGYNEAVNERKNTLQTRAKKIACDPHLDKIDLTEKEANQLLWGAGMQTTLGNFICSIISKGHVVHEYTSASLLSDEHRLKITVKNESLVTIIMHYGEVKSGTTMLVGNKLIDANNQKSLTVSQWKSFVKSLTESDEIKAL